MQTRMWHVKTKLSFNVDSIQLCRKHSANSRMLSIDCRYFKGYSHSVCFCRFYSLPRQVPNSLQMYHTFCLASLPDALFMFTFTITDIHMYLMNKWRTLFNYRRSAHSGKECKKIQAHCLFISKFWCNYLICKEQTLCRFFTCKERVADS